MEGGEEPGWSFKKDWEEAVEAKGADHGVIEAVPKMRRSWGCEVGFPTIGSRGVGMGLLQLWIGT